MTAGIILIFTFLIGAWFYTSAKETGKNKFLWFFLGLFTSFFLGILFTKFGEIYLLPETKSISDAMRNRLPKLFLEAGIMILIGCYAYMIKTLFLSRRKLKNTR